MIKIDLREYLSAGPVRIKSPLVGEVYLALDGDAEKVPPGSVCYTYSEVAYIASVRNSRFALRALHRLKRSGVRPFLDPRPDYPDTAAWTVLLSFVQEEKLRRLLAALRRTGTVRLDKNLVVRPVPGYEEAYTHIRPELLPYEKEMKNAIVKLKVFYKHVRSGKS